jgi:hypothetical protein
LGARITPISTPATANWHLARYSCAVIADHPSTGRCHAKRGCASEQKCTLHTAHGLHRTVPFKNRAAMGAAFVLARSSGCSASRGDRRKHPRIRPGGAALQFRHFPLAPGSMLACEISDPHVEYHRWH